MPIPPRRAALLAALSTVLTATCVAAPSAAAAPAKWRAPHCLSVSGDGAVTFTPDDGRSVAATSTKLAPVAYARVTALPRANTLLATNKRHIERSTDAGCSWTVVGTTDDDLTFYKLAAGAGSVGYAYGVHAPTIYRVDGDAVARRTGPVPGDGMVGLAASPTDSNEVRAVAEDGQVYASGNGARSWRKVGLPPVAGLYSYTAVMDPHNLDHIIVGTLGSAAFTTFDGGRSWLHATGIGTGPRANVFTAAISAADPQTVWAEGYDSAQSTDAARTIWRSSDGGRTFHPVLNGLQATLINGTELFPHPKNPDLLYFSFGTWVAAYGTDLFRYNARTDTVTAAHNSYDGVNSIVFNPADPHFIYLGLTAVR